MTHNLRFATFRYLLEYGAVRLLTGLLSLLPVRLSSRLAAKGGDAAYYLLKKRRRVALENLKRALGASVSEAEIKKIARASFRHGAVAMLELFLIPRLKKERKTRVEVVGQELLKEGFAGGKGVVIAISHLGSWEYLQWMADYMPEPCSVIVKELKNPYLNRKVNELRRLTTVRPISKKNSMKTVMREIKANHAVAILIDQWAGPEGIWVDFFGHPTSTTSLPARLVKRTGAELFFGFCVRKKAGFYEMRIERAGAAAEESGEDSGEKDITARLNQLLEARIRQYPDQWTWGHRRWKPMPASSRKRREVMS